VILEENIRKTDIQLFKVWEELHIDITANAVKEQRFDQSECQDTFCIPPCPKHY
jgi:hypothetical protein